MMIPEKLTSIERALVAASTMSPHDARNVLRLICEGGMTSGSPVTFEVQQLTPGQVHYAKREKFIKRMQSACDRVLDYAKHETLRNVEKHFRNTGIGSADETSETTPTTARITFKKDRFLEELTAALQDEIAPALATAGQQLFDEIRKDDPWKMPGKAATAYLDARANLFANTSDEIHSEVMQTLQDGLDQGDTRKELMARIASKMDEIKQSRAQTIAHTETASAFNYSRDLAMKEAGVTHKKWLLSHSPLIKEHRLTHVENDGQTVPVGDPFDISGVKFMYPTDDSLGAGPEDIINCHCVAIPVEAPIQSGDVAGHPFHGNQWTSATGGTLEQHEVLKDDERQDKVEMPDILDTKEKLTSGKHIVSVYHRVRKPQSIEDARQGKDPGKFFVGPTGTYDGRSVGEAIKQYYKSNQILKDNEQAGFSDKIYKVAGVHYREYGKNALMRLRPKADWAQKEAWL